MVILGKEDSNASDLDKDSNYSNRQEESDCDTTKDSVSSQGDFLTAEEQKLDEVRNTKQLKKNASEARPKIYDSQTKSSQLKTANSSNINSKTSSKKSAKSNGKTSKLITKKSPGHSNNITTALSDRKPLSVSSPSSESSEGVEDRPCDELKEIEREKDEEVRCLDQASNAAQAAANEDEANNGEADVGEHEDQEALNQKIEEMESKIDKLEEELREVAALEIALYSVVPEHGSSAHKVHSPARRLSRLYIHASKHWSPGRRATIAKNTVSGLVLVARSCGNDVPRLTFWLSNTVVLREIISQAFGKSRGANPFTKYVELNGGGKTSEGKSLKWKGVSGIKQLDKPVIVPFLDDWQDISTFATALEKVESWIFCRIVESIWWQTLAPNMQSPANDVASNKTLGKLLGPTLGDRQQGNFSIKLWKTAFQDAFQRLCPVRAGGHDCGCLPVLARMVMEQCIARLDVAMFNAILRESAHEIPTDPISDPIVDPKVLPIPAGDLSFGSGAQLKNSIGNWSRWLTDSFGMDADDSLNEEQHDIEDDQRQSGENEPKSFILLNSLSDLLMLPKDMLIDCSIRKEVCPSIGLSLLKRILCNFTPDEFCPDSVPGAVLEAVNTESILEQRLSGESSSSFPCPASPVIYVPPSPADVSQKVAEAGWKPQQTRNASLVQKKGYTSDEELDELDSPLPSIIDKSPRSSAASPGNGNETQMKQSGYSGANARYELLREVWSA